MHGRNTPIYRNVAVRPEIYARFISLRASPALTRLSSFISEYLRYGTALSKRSRPQRPHAMRWTALPDRALLPRLYSVFSFPQLTAVPALPCARSEFAI